VVDVNKRKEDGDVCAFSIAFGGRSVQVCGVVWCCVVWCGVVWCGVVWCGVVWCGRCGVGWCGGGWCGVVWCGVVSVVGSVVLVGTIELLVWSVR